MTDEDYMALALQQARDAAQAGEVPVGAVLVRKGQVIARGHNAPVGQVDPTAHAEMTALRAAARQLGNYRLDDCELFVTLEPCAMCAQAMLHARLKRVVFGAREPKTGAAGSVLDLFALRQLNPHTQVTGGVLAHECAAVLQDFFAERRRTVKAQATPLRDDALRTPEARFQPVWERFPTYAAHSRLDRQLPALNGLRLHFLLWGRAQVGQATCLVLHGPEGWWPQCVGVASARAQSGAHVLLPDLIGFGQSDKPKRPQWHSLAEHARYLLEWTHSQGAECLQVVVAPGQWALARQLQALAPDRVERLEVLEGESLLELDDAVINAPFPDQGHRAALKAWADGGWDRDAPDGRVHGGRGR